MMPSKIDKTYLSVCICTEGKVISRSNWTPKPFSVSFPKTHFQGPYVRASDPGAPGKMDRLKLRFLFEKSVHYSGTFTQNKNKGIYLSHQYI